jgi:hypothetical protein
MATADRRTVATVAECLALLAGGDTLLRTLDGDWLLSGIVDLRTAWLTIDAIARELIERGYVEELPRRSFRGSVAEYDPTPAGLSAAGHSSRRPAARAMGPVPLARGSRGARRR